MKKLLVALLVAVSLVFLPFGVPEAKALPSGCGSYFVGFWEHADATGSSWVVCYEGGDIYKTRHLNVPDYFNDRASLVCLKQTVSETNTFLVSYFVDANQRQYLRTRGVRRSHGFVCWGFEWWENDRVSSITISWNRQA